MLNLPYTYRHHPDGELLKLAQARMWDEWTETAKENYRMIEAGRVQTEMILDNCAQPQIVYVEVVNDLYHEIAYAERLSRKHEEMVGFCWKSLLP